MNAEFQSYAVNDLGNSKINLVRRSFDELLEILKENCPSGDSLDEARAELEVACFYAVKAIASYPSHHDGEIL